MPSIDMTSELVAGRTRIAYPDQRHNILLHKTTTLIGPPGSFSFRNVPPGDYKVFAWESVPPLDAEKNPEFVSVYEPFGASVTVVEGTCVQVSFAEIVQRRVQNGRDNDR
jgi:hypothetical protein